MPVGCVSTNKRRKLNSEVEHTLAAALYCLYKFRDWVVTAPSIVVKLPVAEVHQLFSLRNASARLKGLIAQIAQYPVSFKHDAKLAEHIAAAVYIPEAEDPRGGVALKPMAVSRTVRQFTGTPFSIWF